MQSREPRVLRVLSVTLSLFVAGLATVVGGLALIGLTLLQSLREFFKEML